MATQTIDVKVNTQQAIAALNGLKSALAGVTAAVGVNAFVKLSDSVSNLQNRLRSLTSNTEAVTAQFDAIVAIANSSRAPLEAVGDLFFRIARSADQVGISIADAAEITDTLAKGMAASGLSAAEAAGPLLQIGQALQSGRFQGDELRSVLEGMPVVARALADELGVPVGQLRRLGSEGKITAEVFVRAMKNARAGVVDAFGRTIPTITQSMTVLRNSISLAFSEFESNTQTGQTLARVIEYLAFQFYRLSQNIDSIITPVKYAVAALAGLLAYSALGRVFSIATGAISTFATAIYRIGKFFTATSVAGRGFVTVINSIAQLLFKGAAAVLAFLGIKDILNIFDDLNDKTSDTSRELEDFRKKMQDFGKGLDTTTPKVQAYNQVTDQTRLAIRNLVGEYQRSTQATLDQLKAENSVISATQLQKNMAEQLTAAYQKYADQRQKVIEKIDEARAKGDEESKQSIPLLQQALNDLDAAYERHSNALSQVVIEQERLTQAREMEQFVLKRQQEQTDALIKLQDEMAKLTMTEIEKKYYDIEAAANSAARAAIRAEEARRGAPLSQDEQDEYFRRAQVGNEELKKQTQKLFEQNRSFSTGWKRAMNEYVDDATNAAKQAENVFKRATQGMEDAIVDFVKTGKFNFKSLINSILEDMLRSNIKNLFGQMFGGGSKGGGTNIFGTIGKIFGFANGGIIPTNSPVLVGERGPELISGAAGRVVTPNEQLGGTTNVVYNISAVDAASFQALVARDPAFIHAVVQQGARSAPTTRR